MDDDNPRLPHEAAYRIGMGNQEIDRMRYVSNLYGAEAISASGVADENLGFFLFLTW